MKKLKIALGLAVLLMALTLNLRQANDNYGLTDLLGENALAQSYSTASTGTKYDRTCREITVHYTSGTGTGTASISGPAGNSVSISYTSPSESTDVIRQDCSCTPNSNGIFTHCTSCTGTYTNNPPCPRSTVNVTP